MNDSYLFGKYIPEKCVLAELYFNVKIELSVVLAYEI